MKTMPHRLSGDSGPTPKMLITMIFGEPCRTGPSVNGRKQLTGYTSGYNENEAHGTLGLTSDRRGQETRQTGIPQMGYQQPVSTSHGSSGLSAVRLNSAAVSLASELPVGLNG